MKQSEFSLRDVLAELLHRAVWIVLVTAVAAAAVFVTCKLTTVPTYSASVSLFVASRDRTDADGVTYNELSAASRLVDTYVVILRSDTVLDKVAENLNVDLSASQLRNMITASDIDGTEAFRVVVSSPDPTLSVNVANEIASIAPEEIRRVVKAGETVCIDTAKSASRDADNIAANTAIGALVGLLLACAAVIIHFIFDTKIWDETDLERHFDIPVLGVIPTIQTAGSGAASGSTKERTVRP